MAWAVTSRRNRGSCLAAALALAAACRLTGGPLGFLSAASPGPSLRVTSPLVVRAAPLDMTLEVGCKVRAQSPDDGRWYPGRIREASGRNWVVTWDDPDGGPETDTLSKHLVRKMNFCKDYQVGDDCKAISPDDDGWYPGVVAEVLAEDKFRVKWDDPDGGPETVDLHWESMKRATVKRDYKEGDQVLARSPEDGVMYAGTVLKGNNDGMFQVRWADTDGGPEDSLVSPKDMQNPPIPLDKLTPGQKYTGTVTNVKHFGAFVDVGAERQGLLHISQISKERIEDIYSEVEEGQEVEVWIADVDVDGKFFVTMLEQSKFLLHSRFFEGRLWEWLDCEVLQVDHWGATVKVTFDSREEGRAKLLVHEVADTSVDDIHDFVEVGMKARMQLIDVDAEENQMFLSLVDRPGVAPRADGEPVGLASFEGIDPATWLKGTVAAITSFGAFVDVRAPASDATANGLVHITQIKHGFCQSVQAELDVGQEVKVRVISVDTEMGSMELTMKS